METRPDAESMFHEAREMDPPMREGYLKGACGTDIALRAKVDALLKAHDEADNFLKTNDHIDATIVGGSNIEHAGQTIDRYKLLEQIGEGGFGSVWAAEQREPVKRRVAMKIIKLGMDTKQVIARFEAERQALAMMDHPNIAKVLDAGSTETGRPFFVMELVKGVPILDYCDKEKLDTKARLDLFTKVCHAIQHAHQKGIIHRDIKPSNVLVTLHDGVPVPKVIDFGIAKATNAELTSKTVYTQHQQMIGTPAYMSPEQAEMSGLDIDTRSDVYSLGVLLYELLTGTTPFENESLMQAGFAEMMRIIRETEPHKPSTRLSSLGETGTKTAAQRRVDLHKLSTLLRGDLDWIVMKCLEKDRTRRYETASGLAADINRHLSDEPVLAGPPSTKYRLQKFVKRNRGQVIAGGVVAAALLIAVGGTSTGMAWALREKGRANNEATNASRAAEAEKAARLDAQANEQKAIDEAERAERELGRATEIKRLITEMLQSVKPEEAQGADITLLRGILDSAAGRLAGGEIADELIAAELHHVLGEVYRSLALYPEAETHIPIAVEIRLRLLGEEHKETLASMNNLASLYAEQGRYAEAESLRLKTMEISRRALGEEHPNTLAAMNNLAYLFQRQGRYADAEPLMLETLEIERRLLGEEHPDTLGSLTNLAIVYWRQGLYAEAESRMLEVLEIKRRVLGEEHPDTLGAITNLGNLYNSTGRFDDAVAMFEQSLPIKRRVLGVEHPWTGNAMDGLATAYGYLGRFADAEPLFLETLETKRRVLGEEHPGTLGSMNNLAMMFENQGRYAEAEPLYIETIDIQRRVLGEEHPNTLGPLTNLGLLYSKMGRFEDAAEKLETSLSIKREVLGVEHPWTGFAMQGLAAAYDQLDRHDEALPLWRELLEVQTANAASPDADAPMLNAAAWKMLTYDIEELRDPQRALGYAERACTLEETTGGERLWQYLDTLALAQHQTGDTAAAVDTQKRAISLMPEAADPEMYSRLAEYEAALNPGG